MAAPTLYPDRVLPWPIPWGAVELIAASEGCRLRAYRCPSGVPTLGWGHTEGVRMGDICTQHQADLWLVTDLQQRTARVEEMCRRRPTRNELGALVSLAYNVGEAGLRASTVLRQHNAGNTQAAARAFALLNKARVNNGALTTLPGLTARRAREAALYLTPDVYPDEPLPQAVESESSLAASPIARGGTVAAGVGVLEAVRQAGDSVGWLKPAMEAIRATLVDTLGLPVEWLLPAVLVGAGAVVVHWRLQQRRDGWA